VLPAPHGKYFITDEPVIVAALDIVTVVPDIAEIVVFAGIPVPSR